MLNFMHQVMTPEQVADYLQLNTDTVYRLIRQRKLTATQIGRNYRIPKENLEDFLQTHSTRPKIRKALFHRFMEIAGVNPNLSSDVVLEELEQEDKKQNVKSKES